MDLLGWADVALSEASSSPVISCPVVPCEMGIDSSSFSAREVIPPPYPSLSLSFSLSLNFTILKNRI